jgi:hypothetical protein
VHHQHDADADICGTASIEDNLLGVNDGSANCGMDVIHHHNVHQGPMLEIVPIPLP